MTLRECIEKLPNNSILTISKNKKLFREEILNYCEKAKINNLEGSRILICISDINVALPIIVALDGLAESFALISASTSIELILSYKKNGDFDAIICDNEILFKKLKNTTAVFSDFNSLIKSIKPVKLLHRTRWLIATSGTTATPKLVSHTFKCLNIFSNLYYFFIPYFIIFLCRYSFIYLLQFFSCFLLFREEFVESWQQRI